MLCLEARRQHVENELLALAPRRIRRAESFCRKWQSTVHVNRSLSTCVYKLYVIGIPSMNPWEIQCPSRTAKGGNHSFLVSVVFTTKGMMSETGFTHIVQLQLKKPPRLLRTRWAIPFVPGVKSAKNSSTKIVLVSGVRGIQHTKQLKNWWGITRRDVSCVFLGVEGYCLGF